MMGTFSTTRRAFVRWLMLPATLVCLLLGIWKIVLLQVVSGPIALLGGVVGFALFVSRKFRNRWDPSGMVGVVVVATAILFGLSSRGSLAETTWIAASTARPIRQTLEQLGLVGLGICALAFVAQDHSYRPSHAPSPRQGRWLFAILLFFAAADLVAGAVFVDRARWSFAVLAAASFVANFVVGWDACTRQRWLRGVPVAVVLNLPVTFFGAWSATPLESVSVPHPHWWEWARPLLGGVQPLLALALVALMATFDFEAADREAGGGDGR